LSASLPGIRTAIVPTSCVLPTPGYLPPAAGKSSAHLLLLGRHRLGRDLHGHRCLAGVITSRVIDEDQFAIVGVRTHADFLLALVGSATLRERAKNGGITDALFAYISTRIIPKNSNSVQKSTIFIFNAITSPKFWRNFTISHTYFPFRYFATLSTIRYHIAKQRPCFDIRLEHRNLIPEDATLLPRRLFGINVRLKPLPYVAEFLV